MLYAWAVQLIVSLYKESKKHRIPKGTPCFFYFICISRRIRLMLRAIRLFRRMRIRTTFAEQSVNILLNTIQSVNDKRDKNQFGQLIRESDSYHYSNHYDPRSKPKGLSRKSDLLEIRVSNGTDHQIRKQKHRYDEIRGCNLFVK
ncbi:hypothetical protein D3C81_1311830 [compost metagenome]